ncbi:O-antigen polymerase [Roseateles sp.]|uniref:O-antigen polymerase n=1 Tax=Roseateles sp. TaxID=1971397 RepID=UPI003BAD09F2
MAVTLVFGLLFLSLGLTAWRMTHDALHPAAWMPLTWGVVLVGIGSADGLGYLQADIAACATFAAGITCFIAGAIFSTRVTDNFSYFTSSEINYKRLTIAVLLLHAVMLPLWWQEINQIAGETEDLAALAFQLRVLSVSQGETVGPLVGNYLVLGFIVSPLLALGTARGRLPLILYLTPTLIWIGTNLLTNGRSALVQLIIALVYIRLRYGKKLNSSTLIGIVILFITIFSAGAILVSKGDVSEDSEADEIASAVTTNLLDYTLQGPILFSRYMDAPERLNPSWDALVFPCTLASKLDLCKAGPLHQEFLEFTHDGRIGNVYTVFFSIFPKYGWAGLILLMALYGAWATFHHKKAQNPRSLIHILLASYLFSAIVLSIFSDLFLPSLYFFIKTCLVCLFIQHAFPAKSRIDGAHARP